MTWTLHWFNFASYKTVTISLGWNELALWRLLFCIAPRERITYLGLPNEKWRMAVLAKVEMRTTAIIAARYTQMFSGKITVVQKNLSFVLKIEFLSTRKKKYLSSYSDSCLQNNGHGTSTCTLLHYLLKSFHFIPALKDMCKQCVQPYTEYHRSYIRTSQFAPPTADIKRSEVSERGH